MLRRALWVNSLAMFLFAGFASAAAPANKVVIAYSSLNERGAGALLVARDQGFFRKYDLDVSLIFMRSAAVALSALSAGEAQFYSGSANGSALGAMAGGLDLVFVAGLANNSTAPWSRRRRFSRPPISRAKTLRIQSIGGGVWMITQLVLEHWGLDPKRDGINLAHRRRRVGDGPVVDTRDRRCDIRRIRLCDDAQEAGFPRARRLDQARRAISEHGDSWPAAVI